MKVRTLFPALLAVALMALAAAGIGSWVSNAAGADAGDPLTAARFEITIDGHSVGSFAEVGLVSGFEPAELELATKGIVLPSKQKPPTITLKRGLTRNLELSAWHEAARTGDVAARKNASLVMFDVEGRPIARWNFANAWPAKIEIGALKAGASEVLMETVTLVAEDIQRVAP